MNPIRRALRNTTDQWLLAAHGERFAIRHRKLRTIRRGISVNVDWENEKQLYRVSDRSGSIMVSRTSRVAIQWAGLMARQLELGEHYMISPDLVRRGDLVINCGANVGEVSILCARRGADVIAFEPDPTDFRALAENAIQTGKITPHRKALWNETGEIEFFEANRSGDSSAIQPAKFDAIIRVEAIRLDDFDFGDLAERPIRLVKLEAEGAEPEILDGMVETLRRVAFLSVDMGPERGVRQESTRDAVTERLTDHGFRMVGFYPPRHVGLFASPTSDFPIAC